MKDFKFEQKRSLSRSEAADQLMALAVALREGESAELEFGTGTLSFRVPEDLQSEIEVEIDGGQCELEIEFKWPIAPNRTAASPAAAGSVETPRRKSRPAKPGRSGTGTKTGSPGSKATKRSAARAS